MSGIDLTSVAGVAETALAPDVLGDLPADVADAPWTCRGTATLWMTRTSPAARSALPDGVRRWGAPLGVLGGMISYSDTPVGAYREVYGCIGVRRGLAVRHCVSFIAVDSKASLVGGRANWAIPKTLAEFDGAAGQAMSAAGPSWSVSAVPRRIGPRLPMYLPMTIAQQSGTGLGLVSRMRLRGWLRPALVDVQVSSAASLPGWLRSGRHLGMVIESMSFTLAAPVIESRKYDE